MPMPPMPDMPADAVVAGGQGDVAPGRDVDAVRACSTRCSRNPTAGRTDRLAVRVVVVVLRGADAVEQLGVDDPARRVEDDVGRELAAGRACRSSRCPSSGCGRRAGRRASSLTPDEPVRRHVDLADVVVRAVGRGRSRRPSTSASPSTSAVYVISVAVDGWWIPSRLPTLTRVERVVRVAARRCRCRRRRARRTATRSRSRRCPGCSGGAVGPEVVRDGMRSSQSPPGQSRRAALFGV